jgi:hypothetical protein
MPQPGSETSSTLATSPAESLTSEASLTCSQATSPASRSATSSPASEDGVLLCGSQASRMPPRSGPVVHPAKTIQLRLPYMDAGQVSMALALGSPSSGSNSLKPCARQPSPSKTCPESRRGLPRSRDVWRALATEFPDPNDRLPALVLIISAGECGYLPSVMARDFRSPGDPNHPRQLATRGQPLPEVLGLRLPAAFALWMMGFPREWEECMPPAMQSTRGRRLPRSWT